MINAKGKKITQNHALLKDDIQFTEKQQKQKFRIQESQWGCKLMTFLSRGIMTKTERNISGIRDSQWDSEK